MVRVLIAEDEVIERRYLTQLLKGIEHLGILVIASCGDGAEALTEAQLHRPDILILDIEMPNKNGLKAAEEIRHILGDVRVLILTAFSEFEYAKTAIHLGVDDYFIKPGSDEELLEKVISLAEQIEKKRKNQDYLLFVEEQLKQYNGILMEEIMASVMFQREEAKQYFSDFINLQRMESVYFCCCILCPRGKTEQDMIPVIGETLYQEGFGYGAGHCQDEYVFLIYSETQKGFALIEDQISHKILRLSGDRGSCAVSPVYHSSEDVLKSYQDARIQIEKKHTNNPVEPLQKVMRRCEVSWLDAAISGTKIDCTKEAILFTEPFIYQKEGLAYAKEEAYLLYNMLTKDIIRFFNREIFFGDANHMRHKIHQARNSQALQTVVKEFLEAILATTQEEKNKKEDKLVLMVADYMKEHFHENLTLNDVAEQFHMSPYHLSKMFHKTMKKNFIEYLTDLRIQRAKELLMDGMLTVTDIAFMVGYQDSGYFSKVFRKASGLSPREFSETVTKDN